MCTARTARAGAADRALRSVDDCDACFKLVRKWQTNTVLTWMVRHAGIREDLVTRRPRHLPKSIGGLEAVGWDDKQPTFRPIRHAWRVEVAHGRLGRSCRLAKSFENTTASATGWLQVACIATTLRHLPREQTHRRPALQPDRSTPDQARGLRHLSATRIVPKGQGVLEPASRLCEQLGRHGTFGSLSVPLVRLAWPMRGRPCPRTTQTAAGRP